MISRPAQEKQLDLPVHKASDDVERRLLRKDDSGATHQWSQRPTTQLRTQASIGAGHLEIEDTSLGVHASSARTMHKASSVLFERTSAPARSTIRGYALADQLEQANEDKLCSFHLILSS